MAEEGVALFETAVSVVLRGWPALQMAVSHQFGGPQSQAKASWMEEATAQWMRENEDVQCDELETFLETLLDQEFDTIVEDGSTPEVSRKICDLYHKCHSGNEESIRTFLLSHPLAPPPPCDPPDSADGESTKMEEEGGVGVEEVLMEEEEEQKEEEGGWEVVRRQRRKNKQ